MTQYFEECILFHRKVCECVRALLRPISFYRVPQLAKIIRLSLDDGNGSSSPNAVYIKYTPDKGKYPT
jgi:hypothetical protein